MEIKGKIKRIVDTTKGEWKKCEVHLMTGGDYPQTYAIEFFKDKTKLLDGFKKNDKVKILINLNGREWTSPEGVTKVFNTLSAWKIEKDTVSESESHIQEPIIDSDDFIF